MDPRDQTFMTIHNLTPDANILFASDSILDILGYQPDEVRGKSAFDYFHPDEVPFARSIHSRGVLLDKAAVLHYARILSRAGQWVSCECCFTVVHNVLVASTSIYFKGEKSERRARDAPQIRRIFSSSPRDPRYHMLEHLSPKFKMPPMEREPRAALILNRFTRNLTIMYATDAVSQILGLNPEELLERPFYECIQPNCLDEAERCLESAKANESIAYLRFWCKDPRADPNEAVNRREAEEADEMEEDGEGRGCSPNESENDDARDPRSRDSCMDVDDDGPVGDDDGGGSQEEAPPIAGGTRRPRPLQTFELEAVVSCTSDGLVVVLRRARPPIPDPQPPVAPAAFNFENGLFAAPWGNQPIEPYIPHDLLYTFRPPLLPQYMPLRECVKAAGGPPLDQLMRSIRDVAVFAWAVTGINGTLASYGQGRPRLGAQPADGLPVWEPDEDPAPGGELPIKDPTVSVAATSSVFSGGGGGHVYPPEPRVPGYRTRHASLDEGMYDAGSRPAAWGRSSTTTTTTVTTTSSSSSPYPYGGGSAGYTDPDPHPHHHHHHHPYNHHTSHHTNQHHHRSRPPLRPAFSYDALQDHARHQQQQQQQAPYVPAVPASSSSSSSASLSSLSGAAASASRSCMSSNYHHDGFASSSSSSSARGPVARGPAPGSARYFWG